MSNSNKAAVTAITLCAAVVVLSLGYFDTDVATLVQARSSRGLGNVYLRAEVDGSIRKIKAAEGDQIQAQQNLIELNDDEPRAELGKLRLEQARAIFRAGLASGAMSAQSRPNAYKGGPFDAVFIKEFEADRLRRALFASKIDLINARIDGAEKEISSFKPRLQILIESNRIQAKELDAMIKLVDQGLESNSELRKSQQAKLAMENQLQELIAKETVLRSELNKQNFEKQQLQSEFTSKLADEAAEYSSEALRLGELIANLESKLQKFLISSSTPGRITKLSHLNSGEAFRAGEVLVEIAPSMGDVVFEGRVAPQDISVVRSGMPARIVISTYNRHEVKPLRGQVSFVSPSAVADKEGKDYYLVRVTPEAQTVETPIGVEPLGLGLTAEVSISAGKRSVLSFLLSPLLKESEKAFRER